MYLRTHIGVVSVQILETEETLSDRNMNVDCQERFISMCDEFIQHDLNTEELLEFGDLTSSCLDDRLARPDSNDVSSCATAFK